MYRITRRSVMQKYFEGVLLGALAGDCFGSFYEGFSNVSVDSVVSYMNKVKSDKSMKLSFTDDSTMSIGICKSLIERESFNSEHMGKIFAEDYFNNPDRGYGANIGNVFRLMRKNNYANIFEPAKQQFDGRGSMGNGGAMRIAPCALFGYKLHPDEFMKLVSQTTQLTHTNILAIHGAFLLAYAIREVLVLSSSGKQLSADSFLDTLLRKMQAVEKACEGESGDDLPYSTQLSRIRQLLLDPAAATTARVVELLGNEIVALRSVPTAVYAFLKSQTPIEDLENEDLFTRCIVYAVSLGGDTDTIASMAGALAGAQVGKDKLPTDLIERCEDFSVVCDYADRLYQLTTKYLM